MIRAARILLIEPEEDVRRDLDRFLEQAGHEVASVPDAVVARALLGDGLDPDIVVSGEAPASGIDLGLGEFAPHAAHLRLRADRERSSRISEIPDDASWCSRDPDEVLRRVEEVLLAAAPRPMPEMPIVCLDLVRRLAGALPRTRAPEERCAITIEAFDACFGVVGSLLIRRNTSTAEWVEAAQGLDTAMARRLSDEVGRRTIDRGLRPFLTSVEVDGSVRHVAGLPIRSSEEETALVLVLARPPESPPLRQSLINLVGSTLRAAMGADELVRARLDLDVQARSSASLLRMTRELTGVGSRELLGEAILRAVRRDTSVSRAALFLHRETGAALFAPFATAGLRPGQLDRLGLSPHYGVGAACLAAPGLVRLVKLPADGVAVRELQRLDEVGLLWAVALRSEGRPIGILFLGPCEEGVDLEAEDGSTIEVLLEAAALALRNLDRVDELRDIAVGSLRGLVAASEMRDPADRGHADRVARGAVAVGSSLGLAPRDLRDLAMAGLLHDVGKIVVPAVDMIGQEAASARLRMHPITGSRILSRSRPSPSLIQGVEQHHERWDGQGYPYGLRGDGIHLFARILAIADAWDRELAAGGPDAADRAARRLELGAGLLFDPGLAALFVSEIGRNPAHRTVPGDWLDEIVSAP